MGSEEGGRVEEGGGGKEGEEEGQQNETSHVCELEPSTSVGFEREVEREVRTLATFLFNLGARTSSEG